MENLEIDDGVVVISGKLFEAVERFRLRRFPKKNAGEIVVEALAEKVGGRVTA